MQEETHDATELRLFPLEAVLLPGLPMPLHIFEDRYKQLVSACMDADEPFGIVYTGGEHARSIGCTARIVDIVKRYDDGKLDILTRGERKFRLKKVITTKPYAVGAVEYIDDDMDTNRDQLEGLLAQNLTRLARLAKITGSKIDIETLKSMNLVHVSYLIAGLDAFSLEDKQFFLELPTVSQRLLACAQSLANVVQTYDISTAANELLRDDELLHRLN
jgi:Lon protease-like protein